MDKINRYSNVPQGLEALAELRRELRRPVAERDDSWLTLVAHGAGLGISSHLTRAEASAATWERFTTLDENGDPIRNRCGVRCSAVLAVATDRNVRAAIKRLLASNPDAVRRAASSPIVTLPAVVLRRRESVFQALSNLGGAE